MKQKDLKGKYDLVVSLGAPCQVAEQMRRHDLRKCALPFDWTVLESVECLVKAIDNNFEDYFKRENMEVKNRHDHTYLVWDNKYEVMSVHDFPLVDDDDEEKIFSAYPEFSEKMRRRIERFYEEIGQSKKTLFIRYHSSYEDTVKLQECLKKLTNNRFKLIVLNETQEREMIEEDWNIENTYAAQICQAPDIPWQGCQEHWDYVLKGVKVKGQRKNKLFAKKKD